MTVAVTLPQTSLCSASSRTGEGGGWGLGWCPQPPRPQAWAPLTRPAPRLEYEARNQKKEAKELAFLESRRRQEAQPETERL